MEFFANSEKAAITNESLKACRAFYESCDPTTLANGRHNVTNEIFCNVMEYNTNVQEGAVFETHRAYVDVQVLAAGTEKIAMATGKITYDAYIEANDNEPCTAEGRDYVVLNAGDFFAIVPGEPHLPGLAIAESIPVKKMVFKIPVALYNKAR